MDNKPISFAPSFEKNDVMKIPEIDKSVRHAEAKTEQVDIVRA